MILFVDGDIYCLAFVDGRRGCVGAAIVPRSWVGRACNLIDDQFWIELTPLQNHTAVAKCQSMQGRPSRVAADGISRRCRVE